ncbi:MAG: UDP-N-acetylmuramoyl-L-alanine--D-glutamate ligase [Patescibacteria group bacterium]
MNQKKLKVLILGLGRYAAGSGVSAALYFARRGDDVIVTDALPAKEVKNNVAQLKKFTNVKFHLGGLKLKDVDWADIVAKNPGVRRNDPMYLRAKKLGKPIVNDITIFFEKCPCKTVGITGTRGKTTTTAWIGDMLKRSGRRVFVGGNITVSPLTFLAKLKKTDIAVVELSSWLLETCGEVGVSPNIAVWTNVMNDHLNTYDGLEDYAEAKAQIMRHQKPTDIFIPNLDDKLVSSYIAEAPSIIKGFSRQKKAQAQAQAWIVNGQLMLKSGKKITSVISLDKIGLAGAHNIANALAATVAASEAGATLKGIRESLQKFNGVPYRQEIVAVKNGITYVNDTTSTTPDAAAAAIQRFAGKDHTLHWICGGADKGLAYDDLSSLVASTGPRTPDPGLINIQILDGTAFKRFSSALNKRGIKFTKNSSLKSAFANCLKNAVKGDIILLSPACASFGLFRNEFDRGDQFNELVKSIA